MNNIELRNLKLNKLLYNKIDFINNINKAIGELPFDIINYIMENNFYTDDNFIISCFMSAALGLFNFGGGGNF